MNTWVVLLRAVNVAGRNLLAMSDLRGLLDGLGFADVKTLLQSGNAVCRRAKKEPAAVVEAMLEKESARQLKLPVDFVVRSPEEWDQIVAGNPFRAEAKADPGRLVAMILKTAPTAAGVKALQAAISGPERLRASGAQLYIVYPDGMGRSKLTNVAIEKALGIRGTARNWNTVLKLQRAVQELSALPRS